jgi:hypothetical protein
MNVKDPMFGAVGNGIADDTSAINSALSYVNGLGGGSIFFPAGEYKITSVLTLYSNISIYGEGISASIIVPSTVNMTALSLVYTTQTSANLFIRDISISCVVAGVTGIQFTLAQKTAMVNMDFNGCLTNFVIDRGRIHTIQNITSSGTSTLKAGNCFIISSVDDDYVFSVKMSNYFILNVGNGVNGAPAAIYLRRVIASDFNNIEANDLATPNNLGLPAIVMENDCQGNRITNSILGRPSYGILLQQGAGSANVPTFNVISNFDVDQPTVGGIVINGATQLTCIGGNITTSNYPESIAVSGILIQSTGNTSSTFKSGYITISNFIVDGFTNTASGAGINLSHVEKVKIISCKFINNGIGIGIGTDCTDITVFNNEINCTVALAGNPAQAGNLISDSSGINFNSSVISVTTPSLPASGTAVTNNTGFKVRIFISGGSVNVIAINGTNVGAFTGMLVLLPTETIALTYGTAPAWHWLIF